MRITSAEAQTIKNIISSILGASNRVWLFGSRADDNLFGGDIDLFIETEALLPNRVEIICSLYGALIMALGDRKLDIVLKDARTVEAPIFEIARRTGIML